MRFAPFSKPYVVPDDKKIERTTAARVFHERLLIERLKQKNGLEGPYNTPLILPFHYKQAPKMWRALPQAVGLNWPSVSSHQKKRRACKTTTHLVGTLKNLSTMRSGDHVRV